MGQKNLRQITSPNKANSCYFRLSVRPPYRRALIHIIERCNLHCIHCFNFSGNYGELMSLESIQNKLIPKLKECHVTTVTLTGGEPFLHPQILEIVKALRKDDIRVAICTNATLITLGQIEMLSKIGNVHVNVSLHGFTSESQGKFCGDKRAFKKIIKTVRLLSRYNLLQGFLVSVNNFTKLNEYLEICKFAIQNEAVYVHFNPICEMGRGIEASKKFGTSLETLRKIRKITSPFSSLIQLVYIRFPNDEKLPLQSCEAGRIIDILVDGKVGICPYLYSATTNPNSLYHADEFIVGNLFKDDDIVRRLDSYNFFEKYQIGNHPMCKNCIYNFQCGKGCPATIIVLGKQIGKLDSLCPNITKGN